MENMLLKRPYKFKKSYGGTPEPQTPQDAPWLRAPSVTASIAHSGATARILAREVEGT
jgi:hypothetical protein